MTMNSQDLIVFIPVLTDRIKKMTDVLYKGQENDALFLLPDIIDGIESVMTMYRGIVNTPVRIIDLNNALSAANSMIESKNFIQLADIFEFEIIAALSGILDEAISKNSN